MPGAKLTACSSLRLAPCSLFTAPCYPVATSPFVPAPARLRLFMAPLRIFPPADSTP
jgi:hypothetical protein